MIQHQLTRTGGQHVCSLCGQTWKSKPVSLCPGVWMYDWRAAPDNLKTPYQLKQLHLHRGKPKGCVAFRRSVVYLYDQAEATPWTPEEIAADRERKRKARYRHCSYCSKDVLRKNWDEELKCCDTCSPAVYQAREEAERIEHQLYWEKVERKHQLARADCIRQACAWLANPDAVILDTETTGLDYEDEIVQIAIIGMTGPVLYNGLVRPTQPVSEMAAHIHGLTAEALASAPTLTEIYPHLVELLKDRIVISYNAGFDGRLLGQSCRRYDLPVLPIRELWCAMHLYAPYHGDWNEYHEEWRWQKLPGGDHTALGDCLATLELLKRMAAGDRNEQS